MLKVNMLFHDYLKVLNMSKKQFPKIAACLATYNNIRYLPKHLNSIFMQDEVAEI